MNLTERERAILQLAEQGLSDYKIARKMSMDPPNVTRSRRNALKKLVKAFTDIEWAARLGISVCERNFGIAESSVSSYSFFL